MASELCTVVNQQRKAWGLLPKAGLNAFYSELAQIAQVPSGFDFPGRKLSATFHYTVLLWIERLERRSASLGRDWILSSDDFHFDGSIDQQWTIAQSDPSPATLAENTIAYADAKIFYYTALREAMPSLPTSRRAVSLGRLKSNSATHLRPPAGWERSPRRKRQPLYYNGTAPSPTFRKRPRNSIRRITYQGAGSIHEEIVRILRRIEHWHQGSVTSYRILYQDAAGLGGEVTWDGEKAEFVATR